MVMTNTFSADCTLIRAPHPEVYCASETNSVVVRS